MAALVPYSQQSPHIDLSFPLEQTHEHVYHFPESSFIALNSQKIVDVSHVKINLSGIFIGGIGYGGGASKLLARTMQVIGNEECVYSAPFCIEGYCEKFGVVSTEDIDMSDEEVQTSIGDAIKAGYTLINIPLNIDAHASLLSIAVTNGTAVLRFYDSLSPDIVSYDKRYNEALIDRLRIRLPPSLVLSPEKPEVLHLLSQGGADSSGCGYYALHTALLLKENEEFRNIRSFKEAPLLDERADKRIRADLVIRSLLAKGLENVDTSFIALDSGSRDHLFDRIGLQVRGVIAQLKPRVA